MSKTKVYLVIAVLFATLLGTPTILTLAQQTPLIEVAIGDDVFDLAWSPDGQLLAVATNVGVRVFDNNLQEVAELTGHTGYVFSVAWKPDGNQLASGGSVGDNSIRIWDYDPVTGDFSLRTVIPTVSTIVSLLKWSPDGTKLASLLDLDTALTNNPGIIGHVQIWDAVTFAPLRGEPGRVSDPSRSLDWSPDSTSVVVGGNNVIGIVGEESLPNAWHIPLQFPANAISWSIGNKVAFSSVSLDILDGETGGFLYSLDLPVTPGIIYWHPSGDYLLVDGSNSLDIINAITGEVARSFPLPIGVWPWRFAWRPDGNRLAVGTKDGVIQIWDTSNLAGLPSTPTPTPTPVPTPRIAFESNRFGDYEVFTMLPDGTDVVRLTTNAATDGRVGWSPDHTRLAFMSGRDDTMGEIYTMNADGSSVVRLTTNVGQIDSHPDWSPDGTRIAFTRANTIMLMNADGTNVVTLTPGSHPDWSPDGTKLVYWNTTAGNSDIYAINADGTSLVRLTTGSAREDVPQWSPDGTRIAYSREVASGNFDIYTMNANGSGVVHVTTGSAVDRYPAWSPDGSEIVFTRGSHLYVMNADGTNAQQVTTGVGGNYYPDWR